MHDHEAAQVRDGALEAACTRCRTRSPRRGRPAPPPRGRAGSGARSRPAAARVRRLAHCCHDASTPFTSAQIASFSRRRHAVLAPEVGRCRRSDSRSPSAAAPRRPGASTPCGRTRPRLRRMVDQFLRIGVELDPLRGGDGLALVDEAARRARAGRAARRRGRASGRVSAPIGFVARVEDHLAPLRAARVLRRPSSACRRACTRRRGARPPRTGAGCASNGPSVVSPLTSHCT